MQTVFTASGTKSVSIVVLGVLAAATLGLYWSVRLAIANWFEASASLSAIVHVIALAPGNEECLRRAAELTEEAGGDGTSYYTQAVNVDPYAANAWVQLGLHAERDGRYKKAERDLLQAVRVDQSFELRWALANFYFRRGETSKTLYWIRKSLSVGEGDLTAVFRLCWQATRDPGRILLEAMPNRPGVLGQYLEFLFSTNRFDESTPIAIELAGIADTNQIEALLDYCDRALAAVRPDQAAIVWNELSGRNLIRQPGISSNSVHLVRNSDFHQLLTGRGFDWKASASGVLADNGGADGLQIEFSGKQGNEGGILSQYVQLSPGFQYRLRVKYQSENIAPQSGLRWRVLNPFTGKELENASLDLPCGNKGQASIEFAVPPDLRWELLQLLYNRPPGTNRIEGSLRLILVDIAAEK